MDSLNPHIKVNFLKELEKLELLENDRTTKLINRLFEYNLQKKSCGQKLFSDIKEQLFQIPTIKALIALRDNYNRVSESFLNIISLLF